MLEWPGNDEKMTSNSSLKLRFSESSWNVSRGFWFQFGVILEVCLPEVCHFVKN